MASIAGAMTNIWSDVHEGVADQLSELMTGRLIGKQGRRQLSPTVSGQFTISLRHLRCDFHKICYVSLPQLQFVVMY